MKTTLLSKENNRARFSMEFTAEEFDKSVIGAYQKTKAQYPVNGFRKGKAPRKVIESHYGSGIFFEDAINNLFRSSYPAALDELDLEVIDMPKTDFSTIGHGKPLTITIEVPVYPVVPVKDYKGVTVDQVETVLEDTAVDQELEHMQKRSARLLVADRPVEKNDTVILDYAGFIGEEQFAGGTAKNQTLKIGSGQFIPGFEEQLIGAKAGDDVDVKVTFPEDYAEDLAGKDAVFHCHIREVKYEELPALDDDFAKDVSEYDTIEELRKATEERLTESLELTHVNDAKDALVDKVSTINRTDAPLPMVLDEIDNMIRELENQMRAQGLGIDQYLGFAGKTLDEFKEDLRPEAAKRVASRIVLRSIAAAEGIVVTDEDVEEQIGRMAEVYKLDKDTIRRTLGDDNMAYFRKDIIITKVIDFLYDNAVITKISEEEAKAKAEEKEKAKEEQEKAEEEAAEASAKAEKDVQDTPATEKDAQDVQEEE